MSGRATRRLWRVAGAGALGVLALLFVDRTEATVGVDIGTAVQALDPRAGDGAARHTEQVTYDDDDLELVATYLVTGGRLDAGAPPAHQELWAIAGQVLPPAQLAEIRQLNVVSDGPNGTLGMVHRSSMVADRWVLSLDRAETPTVLAETLVHELAHLVTLRRDDLRAGDEECGDHDVQIEIGCALGGSALADWAGAFWTDPTQPADFDREHFVSEYAASAVHEDLAESFLAYVAHPEEADTPALAAKLAFFDAHPELATLAAEVRIGLALSPAS
jgi:hypothetical protein